MARTLLLLQSWKTDVFATKVHLACKKSPLQQLAKIILYDTLQEPKPTLKLLRKIHIVKQNRTLAILIEYYHYYVSAS